MNHVHLSGHLYNIPSVLGFVCFAVFSLYPNTVLCVCCVQVFRVPITEEFIEFCSDGALSIEVWGHRSHGFGHMLTLADTAQAKSRSVADRSVCVE